MSEKNILKRIITYMNPKKMEKKIVILWIFWIIFNIVLFVIPSDMVYGTVWLMIPLVGLFIYALVTKDVMQSMFMSTLSMFLMCYKQDAVGGFCGDLTSCLHYRENIEMYMTFFLCGGMIIALKRSGATRAFTQFVTSRAGKSEKAILFSAGMYAAATSVDDYVSAFSTGAAFNPLVDKIKKPRLALAYVVRTFSICVSELLPIGAWGYFVIFVMAEGLDGGVAEATGIFTKSIPYMFYAIVACIIAGLFALGLFPKIGPMKKAYKMMEEEGKQMGDLTDGSEKEEEDFDETDPRKKHVSVWNLIIPIVCIIGALVYTYPDIQCMWAFMVTLGVMAFLYVLQGIFTIGEFVQCIIDGFVDMVDMVIILMLGYAMQEVMYNFGMEEFVQSVCEIVPSAALFPVLIYVLFCISEYIFSLNYTLYQIALPVLLVILPGMGANVPLCVAAVISAGLFGANACVVSDLGIVSARACRVTIFDQYKTSLPYVLIAGVVSALLYLIAGFVFV